MKYSIDGGLTYLEAPEGLKVVVGCIASTDQSDEEMVDLHVNLTDEDVIYDVYASREESLDTLLGSSCDPFDDKVCEAIAAGTKHIAEDLSADPVHFEEGKWWFYDETWTNAHGPYRSKTLAQKALLEYCESCLGFVGEVINKPKL